MPCHHRIHRTFGRCIPAFTQVCSIRLTERRVEWATTRHRERNGWDMPSDIDAIVNERVTSQGPGAAVAVIRNGVVSHAKGYSLANLEWEQPVGLDTVFCIGSLTKPFTAQGILQLERAGKLRLDEPVTTYLPEYPMGDRHVTLMHLLTHTSGIANYVTQSGFWEREAMHARSPTELMDLFKSLPPIFA